MTLGLLVFPPSGCTVRESWQDSAFTSFPIQEKGLCMEAASLGYPPLNTAVLAKAGWASVVCLGSDNIR